jgi:hypothetical protein
MNNSGDGQIVTFYSYKGGSGRTMALANVAWILASNGMKVLAVDWDLESPGLGKFFRPFLDPLTLGATPGVIDMIKSYAFAAVQPVERTGEWHREYAQVMRHAVSLDWEFPDDGTLDFLSAGRQNRDYSATVSTFEWDNFYDRLGGGKFFDAMREDMKRNYDYTLIDSRTGVTDIADICTVQFPDVLVDCFVFSDQSIEGGASVAAHIADRYRSRKIRILPVPMHVDDGEKEKLDAGRLLARRRFKGLPTGSTPGQVDQYWRSVEIPYKPYYAFEETLATFGDEPGSPTTLLAAFERLTHEITKGLVSEMPPLEMGLRLEKLELFTRKRPSPPSRLRLSYAPQDKMWADWIEAVATRAGFEVRHPSFDIEYIDETFGVDDAADSEVDTFILAILSDYYLSSTNGRRIRELITSDTVRRSLVAVRVAHGSAPAIFFQRPPVDMVGLTRDEAVAALLGALGIQAPSASERPEDEPRFPGAAPRKSNVPSRNSTFTGRVDLLDKLRNELQGGGHAVVVPQALHGLGGVGKTQVAIEYAHRFEADYDLIWWVAADDVNQIRSALSELATPLGLRPSDNVTETAHHVLNALAHGDVFPRWLLIFDNAGGPEEIEPFIPSGPGHVIITSLNQVWARLAGTLEVNVYSRDEAIEHLLQVVPDMDSRDAEKLADALGDLPLAIEQAGAMLRESAMSVDTYVELLDRQATSILSANQAPGYPLPVVSTWQISFNRLQEKSPAAVRLLQLLAFFSSGPISLNVLYSTAVIKPLAVVEEKYQEVIQIAALTREINRYALIQTDQRNNAIRVHRLVQAVLRSEMAEELRLATCRDVHAILVAARPHLGGPDDPNNWRRYELIWPHLLPSEAIENGDNETRDLLIEWVRYQWKRGEFDHGLELARELERTWSTQLGPNDRQTLYLRFHIGNLLRSLGRYQDAYYVDKDVLARQRTVLDKDHPAIQITAGGVAADLRALGRFTEALKQAQEAYDRLKELLGEDSRRTWAAANNLAVSLRLVGDFREARVLDERAFEWRTRSLGSDHPDTLFSAANLARDIREAGEFSESADRLQSTYDSYRRVLDDDSLETLRTAKSLAVSLRRAGDYRAAMEYTLTAQEHYLRRYGAHSPDALACSLNLAMDYAMVDDRPRARALTSTVISEYEQNLGKNHPYTLAAMNNLFAILQGMGEGVEATRLGNRTWRAMRRKLGVYHPFALSCAVNLANCLSDSGNPAEAETLQRDTLAALREKLGARHPETLVCEANLAITLHQNGQEDYATQVRDRVLDEFDIILGEGHPDSEALRQWQRLFLDLEPQPV